jgi:DNA topoisomerase-1
MGIDLSNSRLIMKFLLIKKVSGRTEGAVKKRRWSGWLPMRTEGEAIAWHLADELKLKPENRKRIVFHEITKNAILKAIENQEILIKTWLTLNKREEFWTESLVSRCHRFFGKSKTGLSAGRVQSVAVRLIVERKRDP